MALQACLLCAAFSAGDGSKGFGSSKPAPAVKEAEEEAAEGAGEGSSEWSLHMQRRRQDAVPGDCSCRGCEKALYLEVNLLRGTGDVSQRGSLCVASRVPLQLVKPIWMAWVSFARAAVKAPP